MGRSNQWSPPKLSPGATAVYYIYNDIETDIISQLSKFADDCKITRKVTTDEDTDEVQQDINKLGNWSDKWQLIFHPDKCKTLHLGYNNRKTEYQLKGITIKDITEDMQKLSKRQIKY